MHGSNKFLSCLISILMIYSFGYGMEKSHATLEQAFTNLHEADIKHTEATKNLKTATAQQGTVIYKIKSLFLGDLVKRANTKLVSAEANLDSKAKDLATHPDLAALPANALLDHSKFKELSTTALTKLPQETLTKLPPETLNSTLKALDTATLKTHHDALLNNFKSLEAQAKTAQLSDAEGKNLVNTSLVVRNINSILETRLPVVPTTHTLGTALETEQPSSGQPAAQLPAQQTPVKERIESATAPESKQTTEQSKQKAKQKEIAKEAQADRMTDPIGILSPVSIDRPDQNKHLLENLENPKLTPEEKRQTLITLATSFDSTNSPIRGHAVKTLKKLTEEMGKLGKDSSEYKQLQDASIKLRFGLIHAADLRIDPYFPITACDKISASLEALKALEYFKTPEGKEVINQHPEFKTYLEKETQIIEGTKELFNKAEQEAGEYPEYEWVHKTIADFKNLTTPETKIGGDKTSLATRSTDLIGIAIAPKSTETKLPYTPIPQPLPNIPKTIAEKPSSLPTEAKQAEKPPTPEQQPSNLTLSSKEVPKPKPTIEETANALVKLAQQEASISKFEKLNELLKPYEMNKNGTQYQKIAKASFTCASKLYSDAWKIVKFEKNVEQPEKDAAALNALKMQVFLYEHRNSDPKAQKPVAILNKDDIKLLKKMVEESKFVNTEEGRQVLADIEKAETEKAKEDEAQSKKQADLKKQQEEAQQKEKEKLELEKKQQEELNKQASELLTKINIYEQNKKISHDSKPEDPEYQKLVVKGWTDINNAIKNFEDKKLKATVGYTQLKQARFDIASKLFECAHAKLFDDKFKDDNAPKLFKLSAAEEALKAIEYFGSEQAKDDGIIKAQRASGTGWDAFDAFMHKSASLNGKAQKLSSKEIRDAVKSKAAELLPEAKKEIETKEKSGGKESWMDEAVEYIEDFEKLTKK
jgi:hypothetical protein